MQCPMQKEPYHKPCVQRGYSDGEQCWGFCLVGACACQLVSRTRPCCLGGALLETPLFAYGRHAIYYWIQYKLQYFLKLFGICRSERRPRINTHTKMNWELDQQVEATACAIQNSAAFVFSLPGLVLPSVCSKLCT
jgi:hypothetical protein